MIKRLLKFATISSALALFGILVMGSPAHAYTPKFPCQVRNVANAAWPENGHFFWCSQLTLGQDGLALDALNAAKNIPTALKTNFTSNGTDLFVFNTANDYDTYADFATKSTNDVLSAGFSISTQGANHPAPVLAVWESVGMIPLSNTQIYQVTTHEIGHGLDIFFKTASSGSNFQALETQDFSDFDAIGVANVSWTNLPANCTSKTTNGLRLLCEEFNNGNSKEFFADLFASTQPNGTIPADVGTKMNTYFQSRHSNPPVSRYRTQNYVRDLASGARQP